MQEASCRRRGDHRREDHRREDHRREGGEEEQGRFDFVVSRAVMPLPDLVKLIRKNIARRQLNSIGNGLLCLKGGNVDEEVRPFKKYAEVTPLSQWFEEEWFKEKRLIYLPLC